LLDFLKRYSIKRPFRNENMEGGDERG
jgi:hypothetical protein